MSAEVIIIGAGPAGLSLATWLARTGLEVALIDEQAAPGGQVYRGTDKHQDDKEIAAWLGEDYSKGAALLAEARAQNRLRWHLDTSVWDIHSSGNGFEVALLHAEEVSVLRAATVVIATGAMERPTPFPGWTLPGVMSIGAAQTLLKDAKLLPSGEFVLAGQGPLLYLYAAQVLAAGARPQAVLDFAPQWIKLANLYSLARAVGGSMQQIGKGLRLRRKISQAGITHVHDVDAIEANGDQRLQQLRYQSRDQVRELSTNLLLVHDGVVPNTQLSMAAGCRHKWQAQQQCWVAELDPDGKTGQAGLWQLGDAAGILGAEAAALAGKKMARAIAREYAAAPIAFDNAELNSLEKFKTLRHFLDQQYRPLASISSPSDNTLICRCENIKAGEIRELARSACMGPNQLRAFSRAGMGPCMGRQCGSSISQIMACETGKSVGAIGHLTARPPVKPVTLAQLANYSEGKQS